MPLNTVGGKKAKGQKNTNFRMEYAPFAEEHQMYGKAIQMYGNRRFKVQLFNEKLDEKLAIIPGSMKGKRNWIKTSTIVLLGIREFQDNKVDVIYVYTEEQTKELVRRKEFSEKMLKNDEQDDIDDIDFDLEGEDSFDIDML